MATGGEAYVGMFWHSPKYDPVGRMTNKLCEQGAACHASEMLYALPQGHGVGVETHADEEEKQFMYSYRDAVLSFVYGQQGDEWALYNRTTQPMMFWDTHGHHVEHNYRKEQCDILDSSMGEVFPLFLRKRSEDLRLRQELQERQETVAR